MYDSIIVGAGLSGLTAATDLVAQGRDILVLEARDRVGGRVENAGLAGGEVVELGGQWVSEAHEQMRSLITAQGLAFAGPTSGDVVVKMHGTVSQVPSASAAKDSLTPFEFADLGQGLLRFRRLAERIAQNPVWTQANRAWLSQTLGQWINSNLRTDGGRAYFTALTARALGVAPESAALIDALAKAGDGVDLESLVAVNGDLAQQRVVGGVAQVADNLAIGLGDALRLSTPVVGIVREADHAVVVTRDGERLEARTVVVALPPRLLVDLTFDPPLPEERVQLAEKVPPGNVIKAFLVYDSPWWRRSGASGQMGADEGAVRVMFDTSDDTTGKGVLMGFFEGAEASGYGRLSVSLRQRAFEEVVEGAFGKAPSEPVEYLDRDWLSERYTGGCHGAHFAPGLWTTSGPVLAQPLDTVFFAGAEYATSFNGYMEGAVRRGHEVVDEVTAAL
ncbi:FAD-dependent oxidoreductase [Acidipropionibacterium acidipropionici]|jgi:monoamine oxidase/lysyl oxidase-like protein 2/3/4|uniref:Amine oxidase n=2 Tax=Acidipropionibacterium acidipropionici TaxID=1748 RepID=A0A142KGS5_9ACTN|nr:FAD-dependent oxidoreductase [Acidipropionibacterium acidipropionici]AFV90642.1 FAD dependent oxidoreductase [Acidipropionibacterium acidipropionici ATCC 4875]ALN15177.1 amine oxidase [Acidipropionibacterium acidipropionici]AMS05313.1 amine oxidase [Acidipropionibacterium acidipropionici]AOZ46792.1 amine oxidase [Acidipropionibacterium acidipropionici]APZ09074.1 amine oxidase [Acidipropionibacterium acidipropionici]